MDNNLIGAGTISASSSSGNYPPSKAFDDNESTYWASDWVPGSDPVMRAQLYYHFQRPVWVKKLRILPLDENSCHTIALSYSVDGISYTNIKTLDVRTATWKEFELIKPIQLVHLKFDCSVINTINQIIIKEIQVLGQ